MDEKVAVETLKQVKEVLDKHKVKYWLETGTLLGAIRDGKIIPWDRDIDLGTWHSQLSKIYAAIQELPDKEFKLLFQEWSDFIVISRKECPISLSLYHLNNGKATKIWISPKQTFLGSILDYLHRITSEKRQVVQNSHIPDFVTIIFYKILNALPIHMTRKIAEVLWLMNKKNSNVIQLVIPSHYFKNLSKINFYGMEFKIPVQIEEYLSYRYGKKWRIPKKDYVYYEEDGAIIK